MKPINKFQYFCRTSCHPAYINKSILKSIITRASKRCSGSVYLKEYTKKIVPSFPEKRVYHKEKLEVNNNINQNTQGKSNKNSPMLIAQYYPGLHKINKIIRIAFKSIQKSHFTESLIKPFLECFSKDHWLLRIFSQNLNFTKP